MFEIHAFRTDHSGTYNGKGAGWHNTWRYAHTLEDAHRVAKDLVETGGWDTAKITDTNKRDKVEALRDRYDQ